MEGKFRIFVSEVLNEQKDFQTSLHDALQGCKDLDDLQLFSNQFKGIKQLLTEHKKDIFRYEISIRYSFLQKNGFL